MLELTEEALVAASGTVVWADLTDASKLAEWYWPPRFETEAFIDDERYEVRSAVAGIAIEARVLAVEPPHTLRLEWRWAGEEHATDAEITLEPAADGATRVIVRHAGFLDDDERESHVEGWANCLQRLVDRHAQPRISFSS